MKSNKIKTGIKGLDEILFGGFLPEQAYLLRGGPGTGKSTIGYRFLGKGTELEEGTSLLITLSESKENVIRNAASINIDLSRVSILDLSPEEHIYAEAQTYDVFPAEAIEAKPFIESIVEKVEELKPDRVLLDSVSMLKYMHQDPYQYRKVVLSFIRYTCNMGATVLIISETESDGKESQVPFWVDGIINLSYKPGWRRINVTKYRGSKFLTGDHSFKLGSKGPEVFPRIRPAQYNREFQSELLTTGIKELDHMLKGGIEKGTVNLVAGPTGVGKTSLGTQFIKEAALRNERSVLYTFEESADIIIKRTSAIGIDLRDAIASGNLKILSIEPLTYSPDEFSNIVRRDIEQNGTRVVMIDSVSAFRMSFAEEHPLKRLHALGVYLQNMGVTTFLINEAPNVSEGFQMTNMNASYLADNILFLRYIEHSGELRKIIGVLKKRLGDFERTIREFKIDGSGLVLGTPMKNFQGLLTGNPTVTE
ncbi:ATPase domain-containing protein [Halalkalibaculum sp. DA384]|uniref:ATPase domain-containing protein n=1 Tax=Halalkalibaculum sp. DA384 TaxID=3373606 RepID=UPI00375526BB